MQFKFKIIEFKLICYEFNSELQFKVIEIVT